MLLRLRLVPIWIPLPLDTAAFPPLVFGWRAALLGSQINELHPRQRPPLHDVRSWKRLHSGALEDFLALSQQRILLSDLMPLPYHNTHLPGHTVWIQVMHYPAMKNPQPPSTRPLFTPTTLIVGDSIIRHMRFFNITTRCFPGATLPVILDKLPGLLRSLLSSIKWLIVHVGMNDAVRWGSEMTKKDLNDLFNLSSCRKAVFISSPIPWGRALKA